jgi:hypothetical protein
MAETDGDFDSARALCEGWLDWHWQNYPSDWPRGPIIPCIPTAFAQPSTTCGHCMHGHGAAS